ncbi:MAG: selenoneine synthase SenA [Sulfuricella sp.]|nr:selenoneine synthase SenA [Sulfuricella sp.]
MTDNHDVDALSAALIDARAWTRAVYAHLSPAQRRVPCFKIVNPPLWEIGHVGWFQEFWCLRRQEAVPLRPSRLEDADRFFNSAKVAHDDRWNLPLPDWGATWRYLDAVLEDTLAALGGSSPEARYFFRLALLHEDMHTEAMLMTLQTLGYPAPSMPAARLPRPVGQPIVGDVLLPGGTFQLGSRPGQNFAFDNEKWAHPVALAPFSMAATTVTNRAFAAFVEEGGYRRREFWSDSGWQWREARRADAPLYWRGDTGQWLERRFDAWQPLAADEPAMHVSYYEAEAWCRWAGRRLPTEAEWEYAARAGHAEAGDRYAWGVTPCQPGGAALDYVFAGPVPAAALPDADTPGGLRQMLGNVWEWTASPFAPYPGFAVDPYKEYSEPWFHTHQVLRGGSFCTRSRLVHNHFRNFYQPERNDMFAGFRTCALP